MQPRRIAYSTFITLLAATTSFVSTFVALSPISPVSAKTEADRKVEGELSHTLNKDLIHKIQAEFHKPSPILTEGDVRRIKEETEGQQQAQLLGPILELIGDVTDRFDARGDGAKLYKKGDQEFKAGQFEAALKLWLKALDKYTKGGHIAGQNKTLNSIGKAYYALGQNDQALKFYQQVYTSRSPFRSKAGDKERKGASLNGIGEVYARLGQYPDALKFHQQALDIFKQVGDKVGEGESLNYIGEVYSSLGQYPNALQFHQQALDVFKQVGDKARKEQTLNNMGKAYSRLGEYPNALQFHQQALDIYKQAGDKAGEGTSLNYIGEAYSSLGQYPNALKFHQQALDVFKQVGDKTGKGQTLNNIGEAYSSLGQYPDALKFHQQALDIFKQVGDKVGEGASLNDMGEAYSNLGQYSNAEKSLLHAIQVLESLRPGLTDLDKVSIFETQAHVYSLLQQALIAQKKTDTALEIAERSRTRAFVELLATQLSSRSPLQTASTYPTIEQIRNIAKEQNATLVEYSIIYDSSKTQEKEQWGEKLHIWVVQPTGEVAFREVDLKQQKTSLEKLVYDSRLTIGARGRGLPTEPQSSANQAKQLKQLHQLLIQPVVDLLPADPNAHVVFIPQGELFLVPFPALQDKSGKYVVDKHTIRTAPSIQVLDLTRDFARYLRLERFVRKKMAVVVGNPTMPRISQLEMLPNLPAAEQEAKEIARLLQTQVIIGSKASETVIKQQMLQAGTIHLATHGLLNDFQGSGVPGALALTPSEKDDGLLTASEILGMKLNAELVVLSACDTGIGKITGDGVVGLSRSFISAGVPSIVVSLWSVPDAPTASLMTKFYQRLQQNPNRAQALRDAMLATKRDHQNPKDWAAFTLIGEAR